MNNYKINGDKFHKAATSSVRRAGNMEMMNDIDLCNEDTFGSGAVEDDWEVEHNQLVGLDIPNLKGLDIPKAKSNLQPFEFDPLLSPSQLDDDELELSNQQLAAAVEELVLNSDQDQDAIDPAIVSLRKQATPSIGILSASPKLAPYYETTNDQFINPSVSALFGQRPTNIFERGNMRNIWNESERSGFENLPQNILPSSGVPSHFRQASPPPLQDEAILTAIKDNPIDNPTFLDLSNPLILKAEDLERELQLQASSSPRGPSPTYGISIPKPNNHDPLTPEDRSLPARSVSPVFGSPSPSTMPIGTPPKHVIMDMMHQIEQQQKVMDHGSPGNSFGSSGEVPHPSYKLPPGLPQPRFPFILNRPPPPLNGAGMSPRPPNMMWQQPRPGTPINTLIAQDVINRLGLRMPSSPSAKSPIGSPRGFHAPPHMMANQNIRRNMHMPPGGMMSPRIRAPPHGYINGGQRFRHLPPPRFGPGHLHPEHSKFIRMRQERRDHRGYMNHRGQSREGIIGIPGDPYANMMTQKEKDWVVRIQMMALQSDRPEIDDYYYQNYIEHRVREGNFEGNSNKPQRLITPTKPNIENRKYVPVQFVNSLGKLTTSSVYNPRQIIDISHTPSQDEESGNIDSSGENKLALSKRLVIYKTIEKAYDIIVVMEELRFHISTFEHQNANSIKNDLFAKTKLMVEVLGFQDDMKYDFYADPIFQVMKIRKGKKLIGRTMPFLSQDHNVIILQSITAHLAILIKRDLKDRAFHELYSPISEVLSSVNREQFVSICSRSSSFALTAAIKDQVGATIVCKLLDRGRELYDSDVTMDGKDEWEKFVLDVCDVIMTVANPKEGSRHARPSTPSPLLDEFPFAIFEILTDHKREQHSIDELKSSFQRLVTTKSFGVDGISNIAG